MSIALGGIIAFVFRGVNVVLALITVVITSAVLGPDGRGLFVLAITVVGIVSAATGGLTAATAYQVSSQRRSTGSVFLSGSVIGAALGSIALVTGVVLRTAATGDVSIVAAPVALACAAVILNSLAAGIFLGSNAMVRYNCALVGPPALSLACMAFIFFGLGHESAEGALWAYSLGQVITFPALVALAARTGLLRGLRTDLNLAQALLRFTAVAGVASGISFLNYRLDTFVVRHFEGRSGVAVYANAVYIAESVWQVSGSLALAAYGRLGTLDRQAAGELTARVMRHTVLILGSICLGLFLVSGLLVRTLFAPEYAGTATALRFLLPGVGVYGLAAAFSGYYTYHRGRPWASALVAGGGLAIDIALAFALTPRMGVNGAALASAIAYITAILVGLSFFARETHQSPYRLFLPGRVELDDYRRLMGRVRQRVNAAR